MPNSGYAPKDELDDLKRVIYGNGRPGLKSNVESLMEWREREADRSKGNRYLLVAILTVLLPIAITRILDYTSTGKGVTTSGQSSTTYTDQHGNEVHSTTDTKSTQLGVKK